MAELPGLKIAFTGHLDRLVDPTRLEWVRLTWPGAHWVHGGATGFDSQVAAFARCHGIPQSSIRPDYDQHGRGATFIRNRAIVDECAFLVACYDGRVKGGTFYTINYARRKSKVVIILPPTGQVIEQLSLPLA